VRVLGGYNNKQNNRNMFQLINIFTHEPREISCGTYEQAQKVALYLAATEGNLFTIQKKEETKSEHLNQDSGRLLPA
jgi:hypothetical protein